MKKKIFISIITLAVIATGWNFKQNKKNINFTNLALANVEALANGEGADSSCESAYDKWCSFVVATPSGNWIESHPDQKPRP